MRQQRLAAAFGAAILLTLIPTGTATAEDCSSYFGELGPGAAACPCGDNDTYADACARAATKAWNANVCRTSSFLGEMNAALWQTGTSFFSAGSCAALAVTMSACGNTLCEPTEPLGDVDDSHHSGTGTGNADAGTSDDVDPVDPSGDGGGGNWDPFDGIVEASGALTIPGLTQVLADWVITPLFGEDFLLNGTDTQLFLGTVVVAGSIVVGFVASAYAGAAAATYLGTGYLGSAAAGAIPGLIDYLVTQSLLGWASDGRAGEITLEGAATALLLGGALGAFGKYLKGRLTGLGGAANQTDNFADDAFEIVPDVIERGPDLGDVVAAPKGPSGQPQLLQEGRRIDQLARAGAPGADDLREAGRLATLRLYDNVAAEHQALTRKALKIQAEMAGDMPAGMSTSEQEHAFAVLVDTLRSTKHRLELVGNTREAIERQLIEIAHGNY